MMSAQLRTEVLLREAELRKFVKDFPIAEHRDFYIHIAEWACVQLDLLAYREP